MAPCLGGGVTSAKAFFRPTWAEIRLASIKKNILRIRKIIGLRPRIMLVVKANAYGHGAVETARYVQKERLCGCLGVSSVEEGVGLRKSGVGLPILILGSLYPFESFAEAVNHDLSVTVSSLDAAKLVVAASSKHKKKALCHIKLETGMGRIGARKPSVIKIFEELSGSKNAGIEGIYTHLSSADCDREFTMSQIRLFNETLELLPQRQTRHMLKHVANTYAAAHYPESRMDMVRTGIGAYGLVRGFEPALSLKTRIVFLKDVRQGASIGYNRTFKAPKPMKIATIPIGYADGYLRRFSNSADMLVQGIRCRALGITMDMTMIDVSRIERPGVGDEVVVIGRQAGSEITAVELSKIADTIPYETVSIITARVPRIYL
ncbi:MAG: alanine racemase [Elusimicrobia bacterium]|nr:alanine racemase [Elusimicrobiota bacterium]